jgi:hypothetical protein
MVAAAEEGLSQEQHCFLHALIARSVMREDDARTLHREITGSAEAGP